MAYLFLAILPAALIVAAANDLFEFKIPNWVSLILISGFPVAALSIGMPLSFLVEGAAIAAATFVFGFALFALKIAGGGDAKLLAAAAPWFGLDALLPFLTWTAFAGGFFALLILMFRGFPMLPIYARFDWLMELYQTNKGMPYGVAIAIGGLAVIPEAPMFLGVFGG